jgi:hypothetical protein
MTTSRRIRRARCTSGGTIRPSQRKYALQELIFLQSQGTSRRTIFHKGSRGWERPDYRQREAHNYADGGRRWCSSLKDSTKKIMRSRISSGKSLIIPRRWDGRTDRNKGVSGIRHQGRLQARVCLCGYSAACEQLGKHLHCTALKNWDLEHVEWTKSFNDTQINLA